MKVVFIEKLPDGNVTMTEGRLKELLDEAYREGVDSVDTYSKSKASLFYNKKQVQFRATEHARDERGRFIKTN